jgi:hypothetical protein
MTTDKKLYTKEQVDIELLKQKNTDIYSNFTLIYKTLDRIESNQKWMFGLMGTGFLGLLSLIAHGFKWII